MIGNIEGEFTGSIKRTYILESFTFSVSFNMFDVFNPGINLRCLGLLLVLQVDNSKHHHSELMDHHSHMFLRFPDPLKD